MSKFSQKLLSSLCLILVFITTNIVPVLAAEQAQSTQNAEIPVSENQPADNTAVNQESAPNEETVPTKSTEPKTESLSPQESPPADPNKEANPANLEEASSSSSAEINDYFNARFDQLRNLSGFKGDYQTNLSNGTATYNYPLALPPGRNSLAPSLALLYSSQNRKINSIAGYGWDLTIPEIRRVNTHGSEFIYQRNDFYLDLNGQGGMLVPVNTNEYRLQFENGEFLKIDYAPNKWIVTTKNGIKYIFGNDDSAKLKFNDNLASTYLWKISEIRDLNDNFIKFKYEIEEDTAYSYKPAPYPRQVYPAEITYTGYASEEGPIKIKFYRTDRVDPTIDYTPIEYALSTKKIINQIDVLINNQTRGQYFLSYSSNEKRKRSILTSITEKAFNDEGESLQLSPTTFEYSPLTQNGFSSTNFIIEGSLPPLYFITKNVGSYKMIKDEGVRITDVNGDSLPDLIQGLYETEGNSSNEKTRITATYINKSYIDAEGRQVIKFVKDNINNQLNGFIVYNGIEERYGIVTKVAETTLMDFNGDYLLDLMGLIFIPADYSGTGQYYRYSYVNNLVNGWYGENTYGYGLTGNRGTKDMNGDGLIDNLFQNAFPETHLAVNVGKRELKQGEYYIYKESPVWKNTMPVQFYNGGWDKPYGVELGDVNGDGLPDVLEGHHEVYEAFYNRVFFSTGKGFEQIESAWKTPVVFMRHYYTGNITEDVGNRLMDFNGDGLTDFTGNSGDYANNGINGWYNSGGSLTFVRDDKDYGTRLADINGDSLDDAMIAYKYQDPYDNDKWVYVQEIRLNQNKAPDLLTKVTNPYGGKIEINYKPSTAYRETDGKMSNALPFVIQTVSEVKISDNNGNINSTKYHYKKGRFNWYDFHYREFAGFSEVIEEKDDKITNYYFLTGDQSQDRPIDLTQKNYSFNKYSDGQVIRIGDWIYVIDNGQKRRINTVDHMTGSTYPTARYINQCMPFFNSGYAAMSNYWYLVDWKSLLSLIPPVSQEELNSIPDGPYIPYGYDYTDYNYPPTAEQCGNVIQNNPPQSTKIYPAGAVLKGRLSKKTVYDKSGNKWLETFNKYETADLLPGATPGYERYLAKLTQTVEVNYDGNSDSRAKAGQYEYDGYGNLTKETNLGEVNINAETGEVTNDVGTGDNVIKETTFAINTGNYVFAPKEIFIKNSNGEIQKQQRLSYDGLTLGEVNRGNLSKKEDWFNLTNEWIKTEYKYDRDFYPNDTAKQFGLLKQTIDAKGNVTTLFYEFDNINKPSNYPLSSQFNFYPIKTVYAKTGLATFTHYDLGNGSADYFYDFNQHSVSRKFDPLGRIKSVTTENPLNNNGQIEAATVSYFDNVYPVKAYYQALSGTSDPTLESWKYFDALGRLIQEKSKAEDGKFYVKSYKYNAAGELQWETFLKKTSTADFEATDFNAVPKISHAYDALSREIKKDWGPAVGFIQKEYDQWKATETFWAKGAFMQNKKKLVANAFNFLIQTHEYYNADPQKDQPQNDNQFGIFTTNYEYDLTGNLTKIIDAKGNIRTFGYDSLNRQTEFSMIHKADDSDFGKWQYRYDVNNNLTWSKDPNGNEVNYTYDALNRKSTEEFGGKVKEKYSYDADENDGRNALVRNVLGRLSQVEKVEDSGSQVNSFDYDGLNRMIKENKKIDENYYTTATQIDLLGRQKKVVGPNGVETKYEYGETGDLEKVFYRKSADSSFTELISHVDYSEQKTIDKIVYTDGMVKDYEYYDATEMFRLNNLIISDKNGAETKKMHYEYDKAGNILFLKETSALSTAREVNYVYDSLNRLTANNYLGSEGLQNFSYDAIGNFTQKDGEAINAPDYFYTYQKANGNNANSQAVSEIKDNNSQLLKQFFYDLNGNLLQEKNGQGTINKTLSYNYKNQLLTANNENYVYDYAGNRTKKIVEGIVTTYVNTLFDKDNHYETSYIYAGNELIATSQIFNNQKPVAFAGNDFQTTIRTKITLDGSLSSDADKDKLTFSWQLTQKPDGSTVQLQDASTAKPSFTPDKKGDYILSLKVNDGWTDSDLDTVKATAAGDKALSFEFNEALGSTTFIDSSANKLNATCNGTNCPVAEAAGKLDKALSFDGAGDFISIADAPAINPKQAVSIEALIYPQINSAVSSQVIVMKNFDYEMTMLNNGSLRLGITNEAGARVVWNFYPAITFNQWNQLVMTYDGAKIKGYVNGKSVGEKAQTGLIRSSKSKPLMIGGMSSSFSTKGKIDGFGLYNYALTDQEIADKYKTGSTIVSYKFNDALGSTTLADSSGNNRNATCSGANCPTLETAGKIDKAGLFDGAGDNISVVDSIYISPKEEITIEALIYPQVNSAVSSQVIATKNLDYEMTMLNNGSLRLGITNEAGTRVVWNIYPAITFNQWNYLAMTYDGVKIRGYANGKLIGEKEQTGLIRRTMNKPLTIGGFNTSFSAKGTIDEVNLYNYKWEDGDIANKYKAMFNDPTMVYYQFNENAGATSFKDVSANSLNAVCSGVNCPTAGITGKIGKALQFDGVDDFLTVANNAAIKPTTAITLTAWVNPTLQGSSPIQVVASKDADYELDITKTGQVKAGIKNEANVWTSVATAAGAIKANEWAQIGMTYDGTKIRVYVNGILKKEAIKIGNIRQGNGVLQIGRQYTSYYYQGKMDEVWLADKALNDAEMMAKYTGNPVAQSLSPMSFKEANSGKYLLSSKLYYHFSDHLGSSSFVMDAASGKIVQESDYYAFGGKRHYNNLENDLLNNRKQFTGKEQDATGLYYFGARYMDPEIGRFTQMDNVAMFAPQILLTDPQLLNLYAYARNNPIIFIDPNGEFPTLNDVKTELKKDATAVADATTMAIPGLNDLRDWYENKYGKDLITQEELTQDERDMIAAFVAVPLFSGREARMADEGLEIAEKNINKVIDATKQQIKKLDNAFDNIVNKASQSWKRNYKFNKELQEPHKNGSLDKSQWLKETDDKTETINALQNGKVIKLNPDGTPQKIDYNSGKTLGTEGETGVRVHRRQNGTIHGHPIKIK